MVVRGLVVPKLQKIGCGCYLKTYNHLSRPSESRNGTVLRAATCAFPRSVQTAGLAIEVTVKIKLPWLLSWDNQKGAALFALLRTKLR